MRHSSDRGGVEPLAALAAVFAVGAGLTLYAGVIDDSRRTADRSDVPEHVADEILAQADQDGVVRPNLIDPPTVAPPDWTLNVTVRTPGETVYWGPEPPERATRLEQPITVRLAPGNVQTGRLVVEAWR